MILLILLILAGTVFQGVAMFRSGLLYDYGVGYFGPLARDGVWHEALVNQLKLSVPPVNPGFAGQILTNYHYFYDLLVAFVSKSGVSVQFLIYRFFPVIFSVLLGLGTFLLTEKLFKERKVSYLAVFFAFFGSSFGWVLSLIRGEEIGGESSFWANQPVSMNLNPPYAISLVILIFGIILLGNYLKKPKLWQGILLVLTFGLLIGFKAYAGAIGLGALFLLTLKKVVIDKKYSLLPIFLGVAGISAAIYFLVSKGGAGLILFQPFWLVNTMIDAGDRVGIPNFTSRRFAYLGGGRWLNLAAVELISLIIFIAGNLGTRLISFFGYSKKFLKEDLHLFILFTALTSFIPPLLFVQKGNPWNIVQFFYYFMFFAGLYAAHALKKFSLPIVIVILLLTPISSAATFRSWLYPNPPAYLPKGEYEALSFLESQPQGTVLKYPYNESLKRYFKDPYPLYMYADNAYVSAYSGHPVYVEDAEQQTILATDYKERLFSEKGFFTGHHMPTAKQFLFDNNIRYVYLPKVYQLPTAEQEYPMTKIFENDDVKIYQVK